MHVVYLNLLFNTKYNIWYVVVGSIKKIMRQKPAWYPVRPARTRCKSNFLYIKSAKVNSLYS